MARRLSPLPFLAISAGVFLLIAVFLLRQMTEQPWLGARFAPDPDLAGGGIGLLVAEVDARGPTAGLLEPGQRVLMVASTNRQALLSPRLLEAPDIFPTYAQFNHYLREQQWVAEMLASGSTKLVLDNGRSIPVTLEARHPLRTIPLLYLLYLLAGFFCTGVGLMLWHYRPGLFVSWVVLAAGTGTLIYYLSVVLQYRELALPTAWLCLTSALGIVGVNLFAWGYLAVFMLHPLRACGNRWVWALLAAAALVSVNSIWQWVELPFHAYMLHLLLVGVAVYALLFRQWRITRRHPVEHATVRLFVMTMAVPTVLVILFWMVPVILHEPVWMPHEWARFVFAPIALGWAVAVFRYHLFNVEWWWTIGVVWLLGITVIFLPYAAFTYLLGFKPLVALNFSVIAGGMMFFPIEQKLMAGAWRAGAGLTDDPVPDLVHALQTATTDRDFQEAWRDALEKRFQPVSIQRLPEKLENVCFMDEGVVLDVPDVFGNGRYELTGKQHGNWLFNAHDAQVAQSMFELSHAILKATHAREEATLAERIRIMRDLHDSLGAKLLSMAQRCQGTESEDYAREALQTLRDTVHLSSIAEQLDLSELLGDWRMETRERVEIADAKLHWQVEGMGDGMRIRSARALLLRSFLRETISNALKHARPDNVHVRFSVEDEQLRLCVGNDCGVIGAGSWKLGFGLSHLRERLVRAGGQMDITRHSMAGGVFVDEVQASISCGPDG